MTTPGLECPYEASDEASESELLDRSLSVWRGRGSVDSGDEFAPIRLDLHTASSIGQYDSVRTIIQRQEEDLNAKNRGGWTALMYASYIGHDNVVNLLLDARVQVNVKNNKGQTPLMLAASCGNESVAYFLIQQEAELEATDRKGWTALFHATYSGHQNMVKFLLESHADMEAREPVKRYTPFMIAAQEGHEIIVQYFLQHGVSVDAKASNGDNARTLALIHGHMKIVSLIDNYVMGVTSAPRAEPGLRMAEDLSSSDEAVQKPRRHPNMKPGRKPSKGPSIRDGPDAFAKMMGREKTPAKGGSLSDPTLGSYVPTGYVTFPTDNVSTSDAGHIRSRDVTSPINPEDHTGSLDSSGSREFPEYDDDTNAFSKTGALTIKSSSSSSGGLIAALGINHHSTDEDNTQSDPGTRSRSPSKVTGQSSHSDQTDERKHGKENVQAKVVSDASPSSEMPRQQTPTARVPPFPPSQPAPQTTPLPAPNYPLPAQHPMVMPYHGLGMGGTPSTLPPAKNQDFLQERPQDLESLLRELSLLKYLVVFEEQDVDLPVFLSLTDNDLKEVGIGKFGPRRKMTNAIARWHSNAALGGSGLEQAYADKLEAGMQEMAIQLNQAYEQVEQVKAQVRQERELRSVAESCLMHMEDQSSWQQVHLIASDIRQRGMELQENIREMRCYSEELSSRLSLESEENTLVNALNQGLSLEENKSELTNQIKLIPSAQIVQRMRAVQEDMWRSMAITMHNSDKLLVKNMDLGKVREGFS